MKLKFGGLGHDRRILPVASINVTHGRLAEWTLEQSFGRWYDRGRGPLPESTVLVLLDFPLGHL